MKQQEKQPNPEWLTNDLYNKMRRIAKLAFDSFVQTKALQKVNAGPFLANLKTKIEGLVASKPDQALGQIVRGFKQQKKLNIYATVRAA